jgi:hypothetical protein
MNGGDNEAGGVVSGEDDGKSFFKVGVFTTIVSAFGLGEAVFFTVLESNFLTARIFGCGGSTRSAGSGDKSGGILKGLSDDDGLDTCDLVSIDFMGAAFLGGCGDTAGF